MAKPPRKIAFILVTRRNHQASFAEVVPAKTPTEPSQIGDQNSVNQDPGDGHTSEETQDSEEPILKMVEFKVYVDLYKFFLKLCLSVNIFYLGLLGGLLTFLFRPVEKEPGNLLTFLFPPAGNQQRKLLIDTLEPPAVKVALLVTPFIIGCVLMLAFAMGGVYWWISTREINRHIKNKDHKKKDVKVELVTTPFFHLLTFLLIAVTIIFMFVAYLLGKIMAKYGLLFCEGCSLRWPIWLIVVALIVVGLLLLIKFRNGVELKLQRVEKAIGEVMSRDAKGKAGN